ncbi:MAG TPA: iron-sulfur cluster assembly scaffold protein [Chloroflexota bacterium]|nr:iron-sulfur cluster assembly scaffold protein [Chloroflexota bacterium]
MSTLYTEIIQDAYKHPAHRGDLPDHSHSFEDENPLCGDVLRMELQVDGDRVRSARFSGRGCAISQASAELLLDRVEGRAVADALALEKDDVLEELGIPEISPARLKCALLALKVLKGALYGLKA